MTNFEKIRNDKEFIAHIINDADDRLYDKIINWYCKEICKYRMESCDSEGCISSEEMISLWLDSEAE